MKKLCIIIKLCLVAGLCQSSMTFADEPEIAAKQTLSLSQVLNKVLKGSPKLLSYTYGLREADARVVQAGLRPNPELSLIAENFSGDNEFTGNDSSETTIALSQEIELGGKRRYRKEVARLDADNVRRDYEIARLEILSNAANRFLDVASAQQVLMLARESESWMKAAEQSAQARFKAGSASRAELSQASIELMNVQLAVTEAQANLDMARRVLAGQWGEKQPGFGEVQVDIFNLGSNIPALSQLRERLDQSPKLQRYLTLDRLRQAELSLAISQGRKNVNVSLGVRKFEATDNQALTFELSMPLGFSDRNQGGIKAARVNLERLESEKQSSTILLDNKLYGLFHSLQQARRRVELMQSQALPEVEQALTQIDQGYRGGRFSYLELVEAHRQHLSVKRNIIDTAIKYHRKMFMLEQLFGETLTDSPLSLISHKPNKANLLEGLQQ